jgi:hypothetical protein
LAKSWHETKRRIMEAARKVGRSFMMIDQS